MIVGYTTGVFDMFHVGHLNILKRAKALCDYLIVGVSTDEVVKSYKHKVPVISFEDRKAIVEAIRYVDKVIPQTTMDKMKAWEDLHFDILFHGSEWKGTPLYNDYTKRLSTVGAKIIFLPHTEGISSSEICLKIKNEKNEKSY